MNQKELKELIDFLIEKDISEFELERGDVKVRIKRGAEAAASTHETRYVTMPAVVAPVHPGIPAVVPDPEPVKAAEKAPEPAPEENLHLVKSPIVGTFYESPSPGAPPFVKPGDKVALGQVLCIVEAMKLMNEIESDAAGEVVKCYISNGQPIEFGQPLFSIRT